MDTFPRPDAPARAPRTFELHDAEWVEAAPARRPRLSRWILVPAVLAALTGVVLIAFAAIAALATGGLLALRAAVVGQASRLRERFTRRFGR